MTRHAVISGGGIADMYLAYATIARADADNQWWNWQHAPRSRTCIYGLGPADQVALLRRTFADVGGAAPRVLAALDKEAPLYFAAVGQVRAAQWSKGRVTLLGDAAFCNATFGGVGTSLALVGVYVLAGELPRTGDVGSALARYEQFMRRRVDAAPTVSSSMLRRANPHTRRGIRTFKGGARIVASPAARAGMNLFGKRLVNAAAHDIPLPVYR